jgi:hypothetical protein
VIYFAKARKTKLNHKEQTEQGNDAIHIHGRSCRPAA